MSQEQLAADATWQRGFDVADSAARTAFLATYTAPLGPKRGDVIRQIDTGIYYVVIGEGIATPITGLLSDPVNLATQVTGTLADGNLSSNVPLKNQNSVITGVYEFNNNFKQYGRTAKSLEWTSVPFNAGNFTASAGSWTVDSGDVLVQEIAYDGLTMWMAFTIVSTDVSTTPSDLRIAIPNGEVADFRMDAFGFCSDAGATPIGLTITTAAGGTVLSLGKLGSAAWTATSGDNTAVVGVVAFSIEP